MSRLLQYAVVLTLAVITLACGSDEGVEQKASDPIIRVSGSGTALPVLQKLGDAYKARHPEARLDFPSGTDSGGAIKGVLSGTLDIAVANRPLSGAEAGEPLEYHPFARDALVFVVREPNTATDLTTRQIQAIYGGEISNWEEVGGSPGPIVPLDRDPDESARKLAFLPLMEGRPVKARTVVLSKAADMVKGIENTPNSLGYTSLSLLNIMRPQQVRVLTVDGISPNPDSLSRNLYPWQLTFALVVHEDCPPNVRSFVDFVLGPEGERTLERYGNVAVER